MKPNLESKISETDRKKRINYSRKYQLLNFKKVLFSDESTFLLNANTQKVFKIKVSKFTQKSMLNLNSKIMVLGGIFYWGKLHCQKSAKN